MRQDCGVHLPVHEERLAPPHVTHEGSRPAATLKRQAVAAPEGMDGVSVGPAASSANPEEHGQEVEEERAHGAGEYRGEEASGESHGGEERGEDQAEVIGELESGACHGKNAGDSLLLHLFLQPPSTYGSVHWCSLLCATVPTAGPALCT